VVTEAFLLVSFAALALLRVVIAIDAARKRKT
jgi:hypothetical protein